jgi:GTP-binding protein HflX
MNNTFSTTNTAKTAVLIAISTSSRSDSAVREYLDELLLLAQTAGYECSRQFIQKIQRPYIQTYVGSGKLMEIKTYMDENDISIAIFDDELTAGQIRNIERLLMRPVIDRTKLILDIFAQRARTSYAKMQVELAACEYMLPRLRRLWTHLERQRGGTGARGGAGELQMETDRRILADRIALLKENLKKVDQQMTQQRKNRSKIVRIAIVGYTNAGKSTIMNLLSKSNVFAEDKLFATLDTTIRKVSVNDASFLIADTVGFIRKLPTQLIEAFKSTLDEVREADLLMHVVDISHPNFDEQIDVVKRTLSDIGASDKPVYTIFNKIDAYIYVPKDANDLTERAKINIPLEEHIAARSKNPSEPCIFISALERSSAATLRTALYDMVSAIYSERYPFGNVM